MLLHLAGGVNKGCAPRCRLRRIPSTKFRCGAAQLARLVRAHARQVGFDAMASSLYGQRRKKATGNHVLGLAGLILTNLGQTTLLLATRSREKTSWTARREDKENSPDGWHFKRMF